MPYSFQSFAAALCTAVLALTTLVAQDPKKPVDDKPRLPNNWRLLELTDQQKELYYKSAKQRDSRMGELKSEMTKLKSKLTEMKKEFDGLDSGSIFVDLLTPIQKSKLAELQAVSAKKSAEKALEKARKLASKKTKSSTTTKEKEVIKEKEAEAKPSK